MKLQNLVPVLALALGLFAFAPAARAEDATPSQDQKVEQQQIDQALDKAEAGELTEDELMSLDNQMEEFRDRNSRGGNRGGNWGRGHNPGHDIGRRHGGNWGHHPRPIPPRYPHYPVPPRYPVPVPYPAPYPVPYPGPQTWICTAFPTYNTWQNFTGLRSFNQAQAQVSALQQCQWASGAPCIVRGCQLVF